MLCHFLIGVPGSGKSTFATKLATLGYRIISTDAIRQQLYGDEAIQGDWSQIEAVVFKQIQEAFISGFPVIYDATNFKRAFRMEFLAKLNSILSVTPPWIAWHIKTPLETCKEWNQKRSRQVPEAITLSMDKSLQDFPPILGEGFAAVHTIDVTAFDFERIQKQIQNLNRSITNRNNRISQDEFHSYSHLLDFDRLMHLISLIIRYPGIGNLQTTNPSLLENILGKVLQFDDELDEITALMAKLCGNIYADKNALASDLQWLQVQGLVNGDRPLSSSPYAQSNSIISLSATHRYSDRQPFNRLIGLIRHIIYHPFVKVSGEGSLKTLVSQLKKHEIILGNDLDNIRKDIEEVLKPYKILPNFPMRHGYFVGTGILSKYELLKVFELLHPQVDSLSDPLALEIYQTFEQRMHWAKFIDTDSVYPLRAIAHHSMIDSKYLPQESLVNNLSCVENAILDGELLELNRYKGGGKYDGDEDSFFLVYPLQIIFSNAAWYLGFECVSGDNAGLFRFERLDRLFIGKPQDKKRSRQQQQNSLQKLQKLYTASAGIFLGYSALEQSLFLSSDKNQREKVIVKVELWFNDDKFRFITEGTKRFPQMKMSSPVSSVRTNLPKSVFFDKKTGDKEFPNWFQVILPKWSLNDFEFQKWILGFGGNVKVVSPPELVEKIRGIGEGIVRVYEKPYHS